MSADNCEVKEGIESEYELDEPLISEEGEDPIFTCYQSTISQFKRE